MMRTLMYSDEFDVEEKSVNITWYGSTSIIHHLHLDIAAVQLVLTEEAKEKIGTMKNKERRGRRRESKVPFACKNILGRVRTQHTHTLVHLAKET